MSDYLQIRENKINRGKAPMPAFEELALNRDTGAVDETYNPIKRSVYWRYLQRWLNVFPRRQVLVLSGEQLVREPFAVLEQVSQSVVGLEGTTTLSFSCAARDAMRISVWFLAVRVKWPR